MLKTATQIKWSKTILKNPIDPRWSNPLSFRCYILTFGTHMTPVTSRYTSLLYCQCSGFSVSFSQPGRYMRTSAGEQTTLVVRDSRVWQTSGIRKWWKFDGIWNSTFCCLFWMVFFVWNLHVIFQHKKHSNIPLVLSYSKASSMIPCMFFKTYSCDSTQASTCLDMVSPG